MKRKIVVIITKVKTFAKRKQLSYEYDGENPFDNQFLSSNWNSNRFQSI